MFDFHLVLHMFVHRGHTSKGVIITVPAGSLVCRRLQVQVSARRPRHVLFFFPVLLLWQCTCDDESTIWVLLLGLLEKIKKSFSAPEHAVLNLAEPNDSIYGIQLRKWLRFFFQFHFYSLVITAFVSQYISIGIHATTLLLQLRY